MPAVRTGSLLFSAGQLPLQNGTLAYTGKVGAEVSPEEAQDAARICALNALAAVAGEAETLDNIARIVKITGYVASAKDFNRQAEVLNGASDFIGEVFGPAGVHARSAVGIAELPFNASVEVEVVAELKG